MENSDHLSVEQRQENVANLARLMLRYHEGGNLGPVYTRGECQDCGLDPRGLYVYGQFLVCGACAVRRATALTRCAHAAQRGHGTS